MTFITAIPPIPSRHPRSPRSCSARCSPCRANRRRSAFRSRRSPLLALAAERAAHGVLTGPGADYMRRRFDATTPIEIDVATLHALPQPGCARLEVTTRQRDVLEQASAPIRNCAGR